MPEQNQHWHDLTEAQSAPSRSSGVTAPGPDKPDQPAGGMEEKTTKKPTLCQLNLHHVWKRRRNEDGDSYRQCVRCGKDDHWRNGPMDGTWIASI